MSDTVPYTVRKHHMCQEICPKEGISKVQEILISPSDIDTKIDQLHMG